MITVRPAGAPDLDAVRTLLRQYFREFDVISCFEDFDAELAGLPGDYAPPGGTLLVAVTPADGVVGCVGLRALSDGAAEMKRLYLSESARRTGAGRRLVEEVLGVADSLGYSAVRLDTLPTQRAAQGLYASLGFVDVAPYRHNPVEGTRYLERRFERHG